MLLGRRSFLIGGGAALLGSTFPLRRLFERGAVSASGRWGPLLKDPKGVLDLPKDFSYVILQRRGQAMSDGHRVPGAPDGMGCFDLGAQTLALMRNHELDTIGLPGPYALGQAPPHEAYDPESMGGVSRVVVAARTLDVLSSNLVLAGTARNCAGGVSPWGWLTCEETTEPAHGYVFRCSANANRVEPAHRLQALGRFRHEAACVDPRTRIIYLTEDQGDGAFYRFVPDAPERPFSGKLQALRCVGSPAFDTGTGIEVGTRFDVSWVDVPEPDPQNDTVRYQVRQLGAAAFRRGEGIWYDSEQLWFTATTGGPVSAGQVFRLSPGSGSEPDVLELAAQSESTLVLDMPDNITIAPWGEAFICEDSVGGDQFIRVLDSVGRISNFARNAISQSEFAGGCFSPDGQTFFLNIYGDGLTLAVRGPFQT
jgi:uncharacterized repeat protein (TIGR03803 family)